MNPTPDIAGQVLSEVLVALQNMRETKELVSVNVLILVLSGYVVLGLVMFLGLRYFATASGRRDQDYKELLAKKDKDLKDKDGELKEVNSKFQERMEMLTDKHVQAINDNIKTLQAASGAITNLSASTSGLAVETREAVEIYRECLEKSVTKLTQLIRELTK